MKTYYLVAEHDGTGFYLVYVTDNNKDRNVLFEIQARNYIEAQEKILFKKRRRGEDAVL